MASLGIRTILLGALLVANLFSPTPSFAAIDPREELLREIKYEARDFVPDSALEYWLEFQLASIRSTAPVSAESLPIRLSPEMKRTFSVFSERAKKLGKPALERAFSDATKTNRITLGEIRALALALAEKQDQTTPLPPNRARLFRRRDANFKVLASAHNPYWYTDQAFNPEETFSLLGLPINICRVSDRIMIDDSYLLPPSEYLYHYELHAKTMIEAEGRYLKLRGIPPKSAAYYSEVLERLRFVRNLGDAIRKIDDPLLRNVVYVLAHDAFHDFFESQAPLQRFYPSPENLRTYLGRFLTTDAGVRGMNRVETWIDDRFTGLYFKNTMARFKPGDLLPMDYPGRIEQEEIKRGFAWLADFSQFDERTHGDRLAPKLGRTFAKCVYILKSALWIDRFEAKP